VPASPATEATLALVVATVRAADRLTDPHRSTRSCVAEGQAPAVTPGEAADVVARLQQAALNRETIWIGYADAEGQTSSRMVQPLHVDGGQLHALDQGAQRVRAFAVHRITGVATAGL
jgi:predicted DNA-binding transcriptional regulator YafY